MEWIGLGWVLVAASAAALVFAAWVGLAEAWLRRRESRRARSEATPEAYPEMPPP